MNPLADLPTWAVTILALLAAVVLIALNIGWLLSAKAMLEARKRGQGSGARTQADGDRSPRPPVGEHSTPDS